MQYLLLDSPLILYKQPPGFWINIF